MQIEIYTSNFKGGTTHKVVWEIFFGCSKAPNL